MYYLLPAPVHEAVKQEVTDVKTMHLFLHTLVQLSCFVSVYLLIFFTAQPCICIGDLDRQLLCTFNNFFPFLAGNIVCNFCSIALVGHKKDFKFLKQQKWKIIIIKTSCECQLWAVNLQWQSEEKNLFMYVNNNIFDIYSHLTLFTLLFLNNAWDQRQKSRIQCGWLRTTSNVEPLTYELNKYLGRPK